MDKAVLEISVWQIKQLTTAHEAAVSCAKQDLIRSMQAHTNMIRAQINGRSENLNCFWMIYNPEFDNISVNIESHSSRI
jgi:hypothetical protein